MGTHARLPKGVVLDKPMARALLFAATQEGLLDNEPRIGDGFVRQLLSSPPPAELVKDALEHLVLGGVVFVPFWLPPDWKGELFERGIVRSDGEPSREDLLPAPQLPAELILGMLRSRGVPWTEADMRQRLQSFMSAYTAWEAVAGGKSFEGIEIRRLLRQAVSIEAEEYTDEQLRLWQAVQDEYRRVQPLLSCVEAYQRVLTGSVRLGALSALPNAPAINGTLTVPAMADATAQWGLLRVTCKALRRAPVGNSLRETIDLAVSPEGQALRTVLADWAGALRQGVEPATIVLPEVERARKSLAGARTLSRVGERVTWIGVPLAIATAVVTPPVALTLGLSAALVGTVTLALQKRIEGMNRWAMYGWQ